MASVMPGQIWIIIIKFNRLAVLLRRGFVSSPGTEEGSDDREPRGVAFVVKIKSVARTANLCCSIDTIEIPM